MGFDLSSSGTGFVVLKDGEVIDTGVFGAEADFGTYIERDAYMHDKFMAILEMHKPGIIAIEQVAVFRDIHAAKMLIQVQSALHLAIHRVYNNYEEDNVQPYIFFDVTTTQIKKIGIGSSKGDKNVMLLEVFDRYGVKFSDDNIADAFCAAHIAHQLEPFCDRYVKLKEEHPDLSVNKLLLEVENGRLYDPNKDIEPEENYEVMIGLLQSTGMRPLKNNSVEDYYRVYELLKDV